MKAFYHELETILNCKIKIAHLMPQNVAKNHTWLKLSNGDFACIYRQLSELESIFVLKALEAARFESHAIKSSLLTDPEGYKTQALSQKFPVKCWRILFKDNHEDVDEILQSTFENDTIISVGQQERVVLASDEEITPHALHGLLESEALTSVKIVVGNLIMGASDLYQSYVQLLEVSQIAGMLKQNIQVILSDAYLFPLLIKQLKRESAAFYDTVKAHMHPVNDLELEQTALVFFENNLNITETANKLFIHRNTLIYRLNKIESITQYDIRKFNDAINYYLSYLADKIN